MDASPSVAALPEPVPATLAITRSTARFEHVNSIQQRLTSALGLSDRVERELGADELVSTARRSPRHTQSDRPNSMNPTRLIRDAAGLTQQELAERAETSQATIAAYEGGHKSPTWRTVERLAQAADVELVVQCVPPLTREDRRSLALHQAIVERLEQDPEAVLARARASVLRMHTVHTAARPLLDEWRLFLRGAGHCENHSGFLTSHQSGWVA